MKMNSMSNIAKFLDAFEKDRPYFDEIEDFEFYH